MRNKLKLPRFILNSTAWRLFKKIPPTILFFSTASFVIGSVFINNVGPFSGPDLHGAHYKASLAVATGQAFSESESKKSGYGRVNYAEGREDYFKAGDKCVANESVAAAVIMTAYVDDGTKKCLEESADKLTEDTVKVPVTLQYPFFSYVPQAVGLGVGMSTDMEPVDSMQMARYLNLFAYIIIVGISILIIPRGKWFAVFLALLPTSLFLASSLSGDALNVAWSFLFVAYILRLYVKNKTISRRQVSTLFVLGVMLFLLKVAYAPLVFLILAFKNNVISLKKKLILFASIVAVGAILYLIWSSNWSSLNATVDPSKQFGMIIGNLHKAIPGLLFSMVAAPIDILMNTRTIYAIIVSIIAFVMYENIRHKKLVKIKSLGDFFVQYRLQVAGVIALVGSLGLTFAALLLTWTPIGQYGWLDIQGFQGRYLLPLLPLALLVFYLPEMKSKKVRQRR